MNIIFFTGAIILVWKQAVNIVTTDMGSCVRVVVKLVNVKESIEYRIGRA